MRIPKKYGEGRRDACPFCKRQAVAENKDGLGVCIEHKNTLLPELKCLCSKPTYPMKGKFGLFFPCINCGNVSQAKIFEINEKTITNQILKTNTQNMLNKDKKNNNNPKDNFKNQPREITVRADDPIYCG